MTGRKRSRHHLAMQRNSAAAATYRATLKMYRDRIAAGEVVGCAICGRRILYPKKRNPSDQMSLSIDHIRRYSDDDPATWDVSNLRPAHQGCNKRRTPGLLAIPVPDQPDEFTRW